MRTKLNIRDDHRRDTTYEDTQRNDWFWYLGELYLRCNVGAVHINSGVWFDDGTLKNVRVMLVSSVELVATP